MIDVRPYRASVRAAFVASRLPFRRADQPADAMVYAAQSRLLYSWNTLGANMKSKLWRVLVVVGVLSMIVLTATAPRGLGS